MLQEDDHFGENVDFAPTRPTKVRKTTGKEAALRTSNISNQKHFDQNAASTSQGTTTTSKRKRVPDVQHKKRRRKVIFINFIYL